MSIIQMAQALSLGCVPIKHHSISDARWAAMIRSAIDFLACDGPKWHRCHKKPLP